MALTEHLPADRMTSDEIAHCVWLHVEIKKEEPCHYVLLNASFGSQQFPILGGSVRFGLKEAELHVEAIQGTIPPASRWPERNLQLDTTVQVTRTKGQTSTRKDNSGVSAGVSEKGPRAEIDAVIEDVLEEANSTKEEFKVLLHNITSSGSPTRAKWQFCYPAGTEYLAWNLNNQPIGQLDLDQNTGCATINVHCEVLKRSIQILDGEGLIAGLAANRKLAVLRALVRKAIFDHITQYLGCIRLETASND